MRQKNIFSNLDCPRCLVTDETPGGGLFSQVAIVQNQMNSLTQHTINTPYMVGPVHCYSGILDGDPVLFDTGPPTPEAKEYLQGNIDLGSLKHIIITHCHIDHYGQARWLEENSGATLYLPRRDALKIRNHDSRMVQMHDLLAALGFDNNYLESLRRIFENGSLFPSFPKEFLIAENDLPKRLGIEVLSCPGHSQSDLVYVTKDWAVTGDTLLRGVFQSPLLDVDLETGDRFKNYEEYCKSIVKLGGLKGKAVLPAHRHYIRDVDSTLLFYISKLLQRVRQLHPYRDEDNLMRLIDKLLNGRLQDTFHIYLKASEILFMKDFLKQPELLRRSLEQIGLFTDVDEEFHLAAI